MLIDVWLRIFFYDTYFIASLYLWNTCLHIDMIFAFYGYVDLFSIF